MDGKHDQLDGAVVQPSSWTPSLDGNHCRKLASTPLAPSFLRQLHSQATFHLPMDSHLCWGTMEGHTVDAGISSAESIRSGRCRVIKM